MSRIAYLTSLYPAVSHTFIQREIAALRQTGVEVDTVSIRKPAAAHLTGEEEQSAAASTFYIVQSAKNPATLLHAGASAVCNLPALLRTVCLAWRTAPPGLNGMVKQMAYLAEAVVLSRHLKQRQVTHLHNHFADPSANVAMLTSSLSGIPFSYTLHGPAELYEPEKWQLREKTARASFVACISHFARSQAMYFSDPEHWSKLRIIHCGVIPERYAGEAQPDAGSGVRLLFVGRLTAIKGLRVLLEAFGDALEARPDLHLTIVGDGDDRAHLEQMAKPLGASVTFAGFKSQQGVAEALREADIFVLPSFAEGLPVVLMEALASGTPVIATQVAGVNELVEHGTNGFLVPAGDNVSLTQRMLDMAADPALRASMGEHGQAKVAREFDVRIEAARIASLFLGEGGDDVRPEPLKGTR